MRPSKLINRVLLYCLARAAERHNVQLHAFCFMSSHYHMVLTDPDVELPGFMHDFNLAVAKSLNAHLRRRENFWRPGSYGCTALKDDGAILSEIVYVLMNPVAAGLVRTGDAWPGLRSRPRDVTGRHLVAERAGPFFSRCGGEPKTAEFDLARPPICGDLSDEELAQVIERKVEAEEAEIQTKMASEGREFLGRTRIRKLSPNAQATSREPLGELNPRVAASHRSRRIEAIESLKSFLVEHGRALREYLAALRVDLERARDVIFPSGTYLMRVRYAVECHAPP